jgi:hypothetical protein
MLRCACGNYFTLRNSPSIHCCANCYANSRETRPQRQHARRRFPAPCGPHNHPRPEEILTSLELEPAPKEIELEAGGVVFVPLDDAKDEPSAA